MNKLLKSRVTLVVSILFCAMFVALVSLGRPLYSAYLEQVFIGRAADADLSISFDRLDAGFTGVRAARMDLQIPRYFLGVEFPELQARPGFLSLLLMRPSLSFEAAPYSGRLSGKVTHLIGSDLTQIKVNGQNLNISSHPQLQALGIESGLLTFDIENFDLNGQKPVSGKGTLKLENLSKPAATTIYPGMLGSPITIQIPALPELHMEAALNLQNQALDITAFSLNSSFGNVSGSGIINLDERGNLTVINLNSRFHLSSAGTDLIGGLLPLISSGRLRESSSSFDLTVSGRPGSINYRFSPITSG